MKNKNGTDRCNGQSEKEVAVIDFNLLLYKPLNAQTWGKYTPELQKIDRTQSDDLAQEIGKIVQIRMQAERKHNAPYPRSRGKSTEYDILGGSA